MLHRATLALAVLGLALAPVASGGPPSIERFDIDESFADAFLTDVCGVPVTTHLTGHVIVRTFDREQGVVELATLNLAATATSGDNVFRFRDVGADQVRITRDGPILSIIGQIPFGWFGVLKLDLDTGDVVHEPQHTGEAQLEAACAALAA